jgi:hypothetical protein
MIAAFGRYWRSHRGSEVLGLMIAIAGIARLWPLRSHDRWEAIVPVVTLVPLACSCLIAVSLHEPLHELERCAPARPAWYRFTFVLSLHAGAVTAFVGIAGSADVALALSRNLVGFGGLACLAATALGTRISWALPLLYGFIIYFSDAARSPDVFPNTLIAWPFAQPQNLLALTVCGVLALGIMLAVWRGPRLPALGAAS